MPDVDQSKFQRDGYVVIRGLLSSAEVISYREHIIAASGVGDTEFGVSVFEYPDGVSKEREFWPLIYDERLTTPIRELLGASTRYTQHSDLHVHRTGGWHRDCACRKFGVGPDWDTTGDPYRVVRVAIYLQSYEESGSALGVVPGSHRYEHFVRGTPLRYWRTRFRGERLGFRAGRKLGLCSVPEPHEERMLMWTDPKFRPFLTRPSSPTWIRTEPGDCVIFDQRLYHCASPIRGPKYAIYLSYSPENRHALNHLGYYRHFRTDLGYGPLAPELVQRLREKDLYLDAPPSEHVDGFFVDGQRLGTKN